MSKISELMKQAEEYETALKKALTAIEKNVLQEHIQNLKEGVSSGLKDLEKDIQKPKWRLAVTPAFFLLLGASIAIYSFSKLYSKTEYIYEVPTDTGTWVECLQTQDNKYCEVGD